MGIGMCGLMLLCAYLDDKEGKVCTFRSKNSFLMGGMANKL